MFDFDDDNDFNFNNKNEMELGEFIATGMLHGFPEEENQNNTNKNHSNNKQKIYRQKPLQTTKAFSQMGVVEKIFYLIFCAILGAIAIAIIINLPHILKFIWEIIKLIFSLGYLFIFFFIIGVLFK